MRSRYPGFHKLSIEERQKIVMKNFSEQNYEMGWLFCGGLKVEDADLLVENVIGVFSLPYSIATNFLINGREILVPMVVEEPSVVAAASNAARLVREGGGFYSESDPPLMMSQIQLFVDDIDFAKGIIETRKDEILGIAREQDKILENLGGGPIGMEVRTFPEQRFLVVHLVVDVRDAMGANTVNTMAEAVAPKIAEITKGKIGLRILTNLADRRLVRVKVAIPVSALAFQGFRGEDVAFGIEMASRFAEADPYRAVTHNKGIMNGIDPVVIATGNDFRAVEAGAHAYAVKNGKYSPLCLWRYKDNLLEGMLEIPLALGIVGGATKKHPLARFSLKLMGVKTSQELAEVAACVGMANNLAALRALATEGIQKGHMRLHSKSQGLMK